MIDLLTRLRRGFFGDLGDDAQQRMITCMQVATALAGTVLAATDEPDALGQIPPALLPDHQWWVIEFAVPGDVGATKSGQMFVWEALEHENAHLERCVPWVLLGRSKAWEAVIQVASAQPWFFTNGLSAEYAAASPELNALVRWSLAVMDEVGFMTTDEEARLSDVQLRAYVRALQALRVQKKKLRQPNGEHAHGQHANLDSGVAFPDMTSCYS